MKRAQRRSTVCSRIFGQQKFHCLCLYRANFFNRAKSSTAIFFSESQFRLIDIQLPLRDHYSIFVIFFLLPLLFAVLCLSALRRLMFFLFFSFFPILAPFLIRSITTEYAFPCILFVPLFAIFDSIFRVLQTISLRQQYIVCCSIGTLHYYKDHGICYDAEPIPNFHVVHFVQFHVRKFD